MSSAIAAITCTYFGTQKRERIQYRMKMIPKPIFTSAASHPSTRKNFMHRPRSQHPTAARTAAARDPRDAIRVVVVGQLLARPDPARRADPDVAPLDLHVAVRAARVVDVPRDIAAECRVARPAPVDREDPDALPRQVPLLAAPRLRLRDELPLVLDDVDVFVDRLT